MIWRFAKPAVVLAADEKTNVLTGGAFYWPSLKHSVGPTT